MHHAQIVAILAGLGAGSTLFIAGCERKPESAGAPAAPGAPVAAAGDDHAPGEGHDHHHGPAIALGESMIGPFRCVVTRDEGPVVAGGDAAIDATVTGEGVVAAVRFWIGTQDAKGSIKARAAIENPAEPNRWHTHAEAPSPMPEGAMIWVEIETASGEKHAGSFPVTP